MSAQPNREVALFSAAVELPASERAAYLNEACADDPALRQRLEELLRVHQDAITFLENKAPGAQESPIGAQVPDPTIRLSTSPAEKAGDRIGRYKPLQQIGEGGCGVVYMAEQEEPVRRRVALKVIKLGMDTKQVIARFEAERQALALMDHPNIAKVLDAGATETGRPFFVMELVRGIKITDYCDENNLSTEERLKLFTQVCQAVQHAHQKGIIHRDIKPSNILVTISEPGAPGCPKIIDFGIAKATTGQQLTDKTLFTAFEQFIGTPAYMSPEQAMMTALDIDTRTDIYALGVLLYELLTGKTPLDQKELLAAGLEEMRRTIREKEPVRPSTRLSTMLEGELTTAAKHRHTEAPKLIHAVRGDLDWIVMKCLEKDRARRYETANGLANDVLRHLNCEPVVARPPSRLYEFQKTVRRHKFGFAAAAALILVLALGVLVSTMQAVRATHAEAEQHRRGLEAEQARANEARLRGEAQRLQGTAEDQARQIGSQLYASQMKEAFGAWEKGDLTRVEQLLEQHLPRRGQADQRGFEWFYLWRQCHSAQLTLRHDALMRCVAFSPDGRLLATGGDDATARLWNANTGEQLLVMRGHVGNVNSLAFAPDGETLATGSADKTVKLWAVATGEALATLRGHKDPVSALAFSPDGTRLAAAGGYLRSGLGTPHSRLVSEDELQVEVKLWDLAARKASLTLTWHCRSILSVAFSPDGRRLATSSGDGTVRLWNATTGQAEIGVGGFKPLVAAVAFSPDGQTLAIGGGDAWGDEAELELWDLTTQKERTALVGHEDPVLALAFAPDGQTLASAGLDQTLRLWETATGKLVRTIRGHGAAIWSVAYDLSGTRIATASWDHTVKVWDALAPQGWEEFNDAPSYSTSFSPDGKYLALGDGTGMGILEPGAGKPTFRIPGYHPTYCSVAIAPDGSLLVSGGGDGIISLWEMGTWRLLGQLRGHPKRVWQVQFSPDSRTLASADGETVVLWDLAKRTQRAAVRPGIEGMTPLLFLPHEPTLIASGPETTVFLDANTGTELRRLAGIGKAMALSSDGRYLFAWSVAHSAFELLDLATMQPKWRAKPHRALVWQANFSPDNKTLATGGWDGAAKLLDAASGQEMFTFKAPGLVWTVGFSPDSKWWVVGSHSAIKDQVSFFQAATVAEVGAADSPVILLPTGGSNSNAAADAQAGRFGKTISAQPDAVGLWTKSTPAIRAAAGLAWLQTAQRAHLQARPALAERAAKVLEEYADVPATLHLLAWNLHLQGKNDEAEARSQEEVRMCRKLWGNEDFRVAWALGDLTIFLRDQGKLAEAETTIRDSLVIRHKRPGYNLPDAMDPLRLLAELLHAQGKVAEAELVEREAAERGDVALQNEFAWRFATDPDPRNRDGSNAVVYAEKAVAATSRTNVTYLATLAAAYAENGQFTNAVRAQDEAIALLGNSTEKDQFAARLKLYASATPYRDHVVLATRTKDLLDAGRYAEAEPMARECLAQREKEIPDDWRAFNARSMLGGALLGQKKYGEETEAMLVSAYAGMKQRADKIPAEGRPRLQETLQRLVQLYTETSRLGQAGQWKKKLGEFDPAPLAPQSIPARDPEASTNLIDLSSFYNATLTAAWHEPGSAASDLSELPRGIQTFAGVQFDVRGLIQLSASSGGTKRYPNEVRDIPVQRTCRRLHFLHAAIFGGGAADGTKIGSYIVHGASGRQSEFPILMGKSVADWWNQPQEQDKTFRIAWVGQNAESRRQGRTIRLFISTWENPAPGETVSTIDFIGYQKGPAPFLVAVTVE